MTWKVIACADILAKQIYIIKIITFIIFITFCWTYGHRKDSQSWNTFERPRVFLFFCTSKKALTLDKCMVFITDTKHKFHNLIDFYYDSRQDFFRKTGIKTLLLQSW